MVGADQIFKTSPSKGIPKAHMFYFLFCFILGVGFFKVSGGFRLGFPFKREEQRGLRQKRARNQTGLAGFRGSRHGTSGLGPHDSEVHRGGPELPSGESQTRGTCLVRRPETCKETHQFCGSPVLRRTKRCGDSGRKATGKPWRPVSGLIETFLGTPRCRLI